MQTDNDDGNFIYMQAMLHTKDVDEVAIKWYKITGSEQDYLTSVENNNLHQNLCSDDQQHICDVHSSDIPSHLQIPCGKFLDPFMDGAPLGLSGGVSVAVGTKIYVFGGYELAPYYSESENQMCSDESDTTNKVYVKDAAQQNVDLPWGKGPPMIRKRVPTCAAFVDNKMYLFGNVGEIYEYQPGKLPSWWPWAESLDISNLPAEAELNFSEGSWKPLNTPVEEQCFEVTGHTTLDDPNGSKKILTYSLYTKKLLSYDIEEDSWSHHAQNVGEFYTVAFMDGIMYGVGFRSLDSNTIYAYDYLNPNRNSPKPVIDVSNTPGGVILSGLIFIDKDTLCVLTGSHYLAGRVITHLCRLVCSKYRISKKPNKQSGGVDVTAELVSTSNYFLKDVDSFQVALPVLSETRKKKKKKKQHRRRGKKNGTKGNM